MSFINNYFRTMVLALLGCLVSLASLEMSLDHACAAEAPAGTNALTPVAHVDLSRYLGDWYQISHIPQAFEYGGQPCPCARQRFAVSQGAIDVENTCNLLTVDGRFIDLKGSVTYSNSDPSARYASSEFTVTFDSQGQSVSGSYWIVGLDHDYRYAVVSDESGQTLYILSRNPTLPSDLYAEALAEAAGKNLDINQLTMTAQDGCTYPQ